MSRIGRMPIAVPSGVDVAIEGQDVRVKGPKGELSLRVVAPIAVERADDGTLAVTRPDDERQSRSLHGLTRTLIDNMVTGVTDGYSKKPGDRRRRLPGRSPRVRASSSRSGTATRSRWTPPTGISFAVESPTR